jgi:hypothetical protein
MKKITLLLVGIIFILMPHAYSQALLPKLKSHQDLKSKNPSVELVKTHMDTYLKSQQTQAGRKSENADIPTLDSILLENNQFGETEYEYDRFGYDENGLNTFFMQDFYAPAYDELHYYNNENYFYKESGLEDYRTYEEGDNESGLEEYKKVTFVYNNEQLLDTVFYVELINDFVSETYGVIEYNELNQVSSTVIWYEQYDSEKVKMMQEDYYYNSSNSQVENIKSFTNFDSENPILTLSTSFSYNGELLSQVSETVYNTDGEIYEVFTESFVYNENNMPTEWIQLSSASGEEYEMKFEIIYENEDDVIKPIIFKEQLRLNFLDFGRVAKFNMFGKIDGEWQDAGFVNFYYSDSVYVSIKPDKKVNTLNVYPNPAKDMISVDLPTNEPCEVNFYDVSGKLVFQNNQATQKNIDISTLNKGFYLVQISSNGKILGSSKFLKN